MQFSIIPLDLHHYDIYKVHPIQSKLLGKKDDKSYIGSVTISLNGENVNLYCENKQMKNYSEIISNQTYSYYLNKLETA